jgi:membrane protease YdiL (CAAX protease family)
VAWNAHRRGLLLEGLAFCALIGLYIWRLQTLSRYSWCVIAIFLVASVLVRGDSLATLGWRVDNFWPATGNLLYVFVSACIAVCVAGYFLGMQQRPPAHVLEPRRFFGYFLFCVIQQIGLNSMVSNRLMVAFQNPVAVALVAGFIFGLLHWPNPVLVPLTAIAGGVMAWLFLKERNILPLAAGQAVLGSLVWWAFPLQWHHSMRVGPGYWTFHLN